jgi:hypothetical protein
MHYAYLVTQLLRNVLKSIKVDCLQIAVCLNGSYMYGESVLKCTPVHYSKICNDVYLCVCVSCMFMMSGYGVYKINICINQAIQYFLYKLHTDGCVTCYRCAFISLLLAMKIKPKPRYCVFLAMNVRPPNSSILEFSFNSFSINCFVLVLVFGHEGGESRAGQKNRRVSVNKSKVYRVVENS